MLSHTLTPYQAVFLKLMKNVVGVYASTLEYLKQCDLNEENILGSLKKDLTIEDQNRLLFFENEYKDVDENASPDAKETPTREETEVDSSQSPIATENIVEQNLLFDLTSEDEPKTKNTLADLLGSDTFSFWHQKDTNLLEKQPVLNDTTKKHQDWFNIFSELDPLANNNGNIPFLQNSEAT